MKVHIVIPYYPYEGYGEPVYSSLSKKKANKKAKELNLEENKLFPNEDDIYFVCSLELEE